VVIAQRSTGWYVRHSAVYGARPRAKAVLAAVNRVLGTLVDPCYSSETEVAQQSEVGSSASSDVEDFRVPREAKAVDQV